MTAYSYDEESDVWPYFAVTLGSLVLVPWTLSTLYPVVCPPRTQATLPKGVAPFRPPHAEEIDSFQSKQRRGRLFSKRNIFLVTGWVALIGALVLISTQETKTKVDSFDPYEILGVSFSATEKQIKSHYKRLSVKLHPDKIKLAVNQTMEQAEDAWVQITKAYKALTDEVTRNNFLEYGHPDGPQQTEHGIALPKWLVEGQGSPLLVSVYAIVVGLVLPYTIGKWWTGVKSYTRRGIHNKTAARFFSIMAKEQPDYITHKKILEAVSEAEEYKIKFPQYTSKQIYGLLEDYLNRKHNSENAAVMLEAVAIAPKLLDGFADIAIAFKPLEVVQRIIEVQRAIVQAVSLDHLPLGEMLQLPHVDFDQVIKTAKNYGTSSILGFDKSQFKQILGVDSAEDIESVKNTANAVPKIDIVDCYFKVPGEDIVTPQSAAHMVLRIRVRPFGTKRLLNFDTAKLKHELHLDEPIGVLKDPTVTNNEAPLLPATYAPYFPGLHQGKWVVFMTSDKDNKIVEGPGEITRLDVSNLSTLKPDGDAETEGVIGTFKIQLKNPTPPFPGSFSYKVNVLSTAYFGVDAVEKIHIEVKEPPTPSEKSDDDDDISDPEEDSIAGALASARGQSTKKASTKVEDDSDDSDEEEDLSDIDTDTEDESEDPKKK